MNQYVFENKGNTIDYYENNNTISDKYINFHVEKLTKDNGIIK